MPRIEKFELALPEISGLWNSGRIETPYYLLPDYDWSAVIAWWAKLINKFNRKRLAITNHRGEK